MKLRTFLTSAVAAASLLALGSPAALAQTAYKSEYRMSLVLGTAFPWGRGRAVGPTRCASAPMAASTSSFPRRLADPGRPDARVLGPAPGRDRHGRGLDHQLVAPGQAAQPVLAALPDARLRRHRCTHAGRCGQEPVQDAGQGRVVPLAWGENGYREISNSKKPIKTPGDLKA